MTFKEIYAKRFKNRILASPLPKLIASDKKISHSWAVSLDKGKHFYHHPWIQILSCFVFTILPLICFSHFFLPRLSQVGGKSLSSLHFNSRQSESFVGSTSLTTSPKPIFSSKLCVLSHENPSNISFFAVLFSHLLTQPHPLLLCVICWMGKYLLDDWIFHHTDRVLTSDAVWQNNLIIDFIILLFAVFCFRLHVARLLTYIKTKAQLFDWKRLSRREMLCFFGYWQKIELFTQAWQGLEGFFFSWNQWFKWCYATRCFSKGRFPHGKVFMPPKETKKKAHKFSKVANVDDWCWCECHKYSAADWLEGRKGIRRYSKFETHAWLGYGVRSNT